MGRLVEVNFQTMNRVVGEVEMVVVASTPDANHTMKIKGDALAPRQGTVHCFGNKARDASAWRCHSPEEQSDFLLKMIGWTVEGH